MGSALSDCRSAGKDRLPEDGSDCSRIRASPLAMTQRPEVDPLSSNEGRVRAPPERDWRPSDPGTGGWADAERCAILARSVVALAGTSKDLASLVEALPTLLVD